jgi:RNA polymerase sigma factor (sigma-70 family)
MVSNEFFNENDFTKRLESISLHTRRVYCRNVEDYWNKITPLFASDISKDSLYKYIYRETNRLNLYNVHPYDILLEAIVRGIEYITNYEKSIENPKAWLRVTSHNIILEHVKAIKGCYQWSDELTDRLDFTNNEEEKESFNEHPARAWQAFRSLSKPEKRIIIYKLFQNKSYSEINQLASYKNYSQVAIRQQYCRAVKNLRKSFKQLDPDSAV